MVSRESSVAEQAAAAFNRRDWPQAKALALAALHQQPPMPGSEYIAGIACMELGELGPAVGWLQRAAMQFPARTDVGAQLARALSSAGHAREAVATADRVTAQSPTEAPTLDTLGVVYTRANAHTQAAAAFRQAVALAPQVAQYRFNLATSHIYTGAVNSAERELEACLAQQPDFWKAHLTLAQLRRQRPDANHLERLQQLLPAATGATAQMYLHLALAKEYEDLADYPRAFDHLTRGKAAGGSARRHAPGHDQQLFDALARVFFTSQGTAPGADSAAPIFVIGMPRSGTTLVERILSSHPDVHSAGELQNFGLALKRLSGSRTPPLLDDDTITRGRQVDPRELGQAYLDSLMPTVAASPRFIDKLPHNFLYAGFIAQALPNAAIVCLRRNPLDTCLSNFRQLFAQTSPWHDYSFDLLDTGRYYVLFDRLMAHWRQVLPGRILEIDYETLVGHQEATSRALLQHCGLGWDDACLHFEDNPAPVSTASALQVRAPIYRSAMQRWRHYATELSPLRELLAAAGIHMPD